MSKIVTLAAATAFAVALGFTSVAQAASINLSTWTDESIFANHGTPTWVLEGGNLAVKQTINADPSWFVSDFNVQGLTIEGVIEVQTTTDDDYIGFALALTRATRPTSAPTIFSSIGSRPLNPLILPGALTMPQMRW